MVTIFFCHKENVTTGGFCCSPQLLIAKKQDSVENVINLIHKAAGFV